jgi:hypothetical protein
MTVRVLAVDPTYEPSEPPPSGRVAEDAAHAYQEVLGASGLPHLLKIVHLGVPQLEIDRRNR